MNNKLPPQEKMVILPIGMDCSYTKLRHRPYIKDCFMLTKSISPEEMRKLYPAEHLGQ